VDQENLALLYLAAVQALTVLQIKNFMHKSHKYKDFYLSPLFLLFLMYYVKMHNFFFEN